MFNNWFSRISLVVMLFLSSELLVSAQDNSTSPVVSSITAHPNSPELSDLEKACAKSLYKAVTFLEGQIASQVGDVYGAQNLYKIYPSPALKTFIEAGTKHWEKDPSAWWIIPDKPKLPLPNPIPTGVIKFQLMMNLPNMEPQDQAEKLLSEYIRGDYEDYVLTHQLLMLEVGKRRGVAFPSDVIERRQLLLDKIFEEQQSDDYFGDLYAERAMLLLSYGKPSEADARGWIKNLLSTQKEDGSWTDDHPYEVRMSEFSAKFATFPTHSTVLAAHSIALYLARFSSIVAPTPQVCLSAINRAVEAITAAKPEAVPEVFQAVHLEHLLSGDRLKDWISAGKSKLVNDRSAWYLIAGSPRLKLPVPVPHGKARFEWVLDAPQADPVDEARKIFSEFLMQDLDPILLTYQLFMFNIAESRRLELSPAETARKAVFEDRVRTEFSRHTTFSYPMIRLSILRLLYDKDLPRDESESRVRLVLNAQGADGFWPDTLSYPVTYDGESFLLTPSKSLVTLEASYLLALHMAKFHQ